MSRKDQDGHQNVGKQRIQKWILDLGAKGHVAVHVSRRTNRKTLSDDSEREEKIEKDARRVVGKEEDP